MPIAGRGVLSKPNEKYICRQPGSLINFCQSLKKFGNQAGPLSYLRSKGKKCSRYSYRVGLIRRRDADKEWHDTYCIFRKQNVFFIPSLLNMDRSDDFEKVLQFTLFFANSTRCRTTFDLRLHCKSTSFMKQSVHCLTLLGRKSRKLAANFFAGPSPTHFKKFTIGCPPWLWPWSGERDVMSGGSLFPTAGLQEGGGEQREVRMFSMFQCSGCCPRDGEQSRLLLLLDRWVPTY